MKNLLHSFFILVLMKPAFAQAPDSVLRELPDQRTYNSKTYLNTSDNTYVSRLSAGYIHYLAGDGRFKDIDTRLKLDKSGAYYVIDSGLYNVAFAAAIGTGNWDVAYEVPRPVHQKFYDPGKPAPVTRIRWKVLSLGYFDQSRNRYQIIDYAKSVPPVVAGSVITYPQIFNGADVRYLCQNIGVKEEIVLSQTARSTLPDPEKYGLSRNKSYFVVAMEFLLTPNNTKVLAKAANGRVPVDINKSLAFNGDEAIEFEDEHGTVPFFFQKDYAHAVADSVTDFANRTPVKRIFYSQGGKYLLLVGIPWSWLEIAPSGNLIIDPTTNAATNEDVRLYDAGNYGSDTKLAVGKFPNAGNWKSRSLISFNLTGIPSNATVLNAQMKLKYYEKYNNTTGTWVDRWIQTHQMLLGWDEAQADSLKRLTGVNWGAARGKIGGATPDATGAYESTLFVVQDEALPVWKSWDLTALTQKWVSGRVANYGVLLWATNENTSGYVLRFYSSEATNTSDRPYLEVIWSQTPQTVYFLKDHLGSIRAAVSDSGNAATVIGYDDYDPWGYPLATRTKAIPNAYLQGASKNKFTGKERDDDLGLNLDYFGARYYDWLRGQWISVDPLSLKHPNVSPYAYVLNNPMILIDPDGQQVYAAGPAGRHVVINSVVQNLLFWKTRYTRDYNTFLSHIG